MLPAVLSHQTHSTDQNLQSKVSVFFVVEEREREKGDKQHRKSSKGFVEEKSLHNDNTKASLMMEKKFSAPSNFIFSIHR